MQDAVTGLNLESFLHLLRADFGAWATLGLTVLVLGAMAWTSWGSRKALRKCLVLSILAHFGLVLYGGTIPIVRLTLDPSEAKPERERLRRVEVARPDPSENPEADPSSAGKRPADAFAPWDKPQNPLALLDPKLSAPLADRPTLEPSPLVAPERPALAPEAAEPVFEAPPLADPKTRPDATPAGESVVSLPPPPTTTPGTTEDIAAAVVTPLAGAESTASAAISRLLPSRETPTPVAGAIGPRRADPLPSAAAAPSSGLTPLGAEPIAPRSAPDHATTEPAVAVAAAPPSADPEATASAVKTAVDPVPTDTAPEADLRRRARPERPAVAAEIPSRRTPAAPAPIALARVTPSTLPALPESRGMTGARPLTEVPEVYRTRLGPNRSALALRAGASPASEQAVERALDWLARHQDSDGRWDAATAKHDDGVAVKGDDDYTVHCPPGEPCFGECVYWEADTAVTGLALLAYLGAGYTQADGKYAPTVSKGLDFLLSIQKPDGDLRGKSVAVGMYCHAMATIALCEAYALTSDDRLRVPVGRAINFLTRARARDGLAWRYAPGAPIGDTSILGWAVMALKSAREVGMPVPPRVQAGVLTWLDKVADGPARGLARYQPGEAVTPTMTAEAWVCRQFLGAGGPGPASTEAAASLLERPTDRGSHNLYYWYYGTLAMYQHGGDPWVRWNSRVRDELVRLQHASGHSAGSWDPDDSPYGARGGRIYATTLATLTLEVYYRYLRLYDAPKLPSARSTVGPTR